MANVDVDGGEIGVHQPYIPQLLVCYLVEGILILFAEIRWLVGVFEHLFSRFLGQDLFFVDFLD